MSNLNKERLEFAKEAIRLYGDQISSKAQEAILTQRIVEGMSPYEAQLSAGAYFFKVEADPSVWPSNVDPNVVIARQATHPDKSKIWLTFQNDTQYENEGTVTFKVFFDNGRALNIEKIKSK